MYRKGVGIFLLNEKGKVFLGRRSDISETSISGTSKNSNEGWQMPQGGLNRFEAPLVGAKRELLEETGISSISKPLATTQWLKYDLPPTLANTLWQGRYEGQIQKWFAFKFVGTEAEINLNHHQNVEFSAIAVGFKVEIYQQLLQKFSHLIK